MLMGDIVRRIGFRRCWPMRIGGQRVPCRRADGFLARAAGLLGTSSGYLAPGETLVFVSCSSLHTFGMAYPLDLAFLDHAGRVLSAQRNVLPGRVLRCRGAATALEREASDLPWVVVGDEVEFAGRFVDS